MELLTYEAIKDRYFYRTQKWDWLNETMIHVFDSKSPRMVTMDPWPQVVFLDAVGDKTVKEYIRDFYYRYPEGKAPDGLKENIIEVLNGLAVKDWLVEFSDSPVTLHESILKPLHDQGTVDMLGTWKGTYTYNIPDQYKDDRTRKVSFTIRITEVKGETFTGTVEDDLETGGTPGTGRISGGFTQRKLWFDKNMPVYAYIDRDGKHVEDAHKKHPTIVYEGYFSPGKQHCSGNWRFKKKVLIWHGIIPRWVTPGTGQFSMEKESA